MTESHGTLTSRAAMASIAMAVFLLALKLSASAATGSVAMLGSLADTALDILASTVTLYGVRYAAMPADREHRFGHGKAEALAALFQVIVISISAIAILWRAVSRWIEGQATAHAEYGIGVSLVAMAATMVLLVYQRSVIRRTGSVAIHADHVHYQSDVLLNGAVIVALALDQYAGIGWADPLFGVGIAVALLWGAWRASSQAIDQLMDREWPEEKRQAFMAAALKHPELAGLHDLRTRTSGAQDFVQFHVWVDPNLTVAAAHDAMDAVEERLQEEFPGTEILIHLDPEGNVDREGVLPTELAEETGQ
ncbi:Divalent metal cation transporter FieF [Sphingomonas antarctica]|uniref:cation diffusion facilitator family transporter n=1 Tax=Sphingomonas antarctica TaxID=2040274 RepID=UPI0039ECE2A1